MKRVWLRFDTLLGGRRGDARGRIAGIPLTSDVEILKDKAGIPHIFAQNEPDLFTAQGFLHAQDRLWQLELLRRLPEGRTAEIAGPAMADVDHFSLLAGFDRVRRRAIADVGERDRRLLEAYARGINSYIAWAGKRLPVEFRTLKLTPAEWSVEDLCGVLPFTIWSLQTNYDQELFAVQAREHLDEELWAELYPPVAGVELPREPFFEKFRGVRLAPLLPAAYALYPYLASQDDSGALSAGIEGLRAGEAASGGRTVPPLGGQAGTAVSNCWVAADGPGAAPLLANDPHLGMMVPQVWHLCHLCCPTLNVCGVSMVGSPGVILGRNEQVAWGVTNVMADVVDLYLLRVDPKEPTTYFIGEERHRMTSERASIPIAGGESRELVIYRTLHGTVLSRIEEGSEAVVVLKWYGTLPEGSYKEQTIGCFLELPRSRSVEEVLSAGRMMKSACQNLTAADTSGAIGWKATGLLPIRRGYSGRVPADGSDPAVGWEGFLPYEEMPEAFNPERGWIATANNKTVSDGAPHPITYNWLAPYRLERIASMLELPGERSIGGFERMQMDVHALQAERLLPRLLAFEFDDLEAKSAVELLRDWNLESSPGSSGAAVFWVFLTELRSVLVEPLLGEWAPAYLAFSGFSATPADTLLTGGRADRVLAAFGTDAEEALRTACEEALRRAAALLSATCGSDPRRWRWGDLHTYHYEHPGAQGRLSRWLLNRGPYPAYGSSTTVNVSAFDQSRLGTRERYTAMTVPSMRLVTSLADIDSTTIIAPMGQSGKPGNRHYDDMIEPWIRGERLSLPLSRAGAERVAVERVVLTY